MGPGLLFRITGMSECICATSRLGEVRIGRVATLAARDGICEQSSQLSIPFHFERCRLTGIPVGDIHCVSAMPIQSIW